MIVCSFMPNATIGGSGGILLIHVDLFYRDVINKGEYFTWIYKVLHFKNSLCWCYETHC